MDLDKNQQAFFALLKAGLWEQGVKIQPDKTLDCGAILCLAQEQSVVGLVAAGFEQVLDRQFEKKDVIPFIREAVGLEGRNMAMNQFVGVIVGQLRDNGFAPLLVKGQGVAQCYERPLWRACGDIDLLVSKEAYNAASSYLGSRAESVTEEDPLNLHFGMAIDSWPVELHGSLHAGIWRRVDQVLDEIQEEVICQGKFRSWINGSSVICLPAANEDCVFVFSHILQHFYKEGIGLRQICDWSRFLWTYKNIMDYRLLEIRLRRMGVMTEWNAFASLAVNYLGMPVDAMPFYSSAKRWKRKANRIMTFILETGNFGHNRDYSYQRKYPFIIKKTISFWKHIKDFFRYFFIFPLDSIKTMWNRILWGIKVAVSRQK